MDMHSLTDAARKEGARRDPLFAMPINNWSGEPILIGITGIFHLTDERFMIKYMCLIMNVRVSMPFGGYRA